MLQAVSGLKEVDAAVATGVTSDMLASLEKQMQAATTSVRVALLHMPTGMDHAVAAMECCQATITGKDFVGTCLTSASIVSDSIANLRPIPAMSNRCSKLEHMAADSIESDECKFAFKRLEQQACT